MSIKTNPVLSGTLLIAGTSIGAGMLAIPVTTASSGWLGALGILIVCWFVMYLAGLLVVEVSLWLPKGTHFISMARLTLGIPGKWVAWFSYLALLYTLMAAYLVGGGGILTHLMLSGPKDVQAIAHYHWVSPAIWAMVAALVVARGAHWVNIFNRFLIIGLIIGYFVLIATAAPHVRMLHLSHSHLSSLWAALPVVITAYGYHVVIPTIRNHMTENTKKLSFIMLWGTLLPLLVYCVWEIIVLGTVPLEGPHGLLQVLKTGNPGDGLAAALTDVVKTPWVHFGVDLFVFFAITSSYLGISFALFDFISDGIHAHQESNRRVFALLLTFLPPLLYATFYPHGFIVALAYAGIFVAVLHGIIPAAMAVAGRRAEYSGGYTTPGGSLTPWLVFLFSILVIVCDIYYST